MSGERTNVRGRRSIRRGVFLLARFRAAGFAEFGAAPQDFLNALAPLAGLTLAMTLMGAADGEFLSGVLGVLISAVGLLAPPVITHGLAMRWGREAAWLRYAVAFTWCHWAVLMVFALTLFVLMLCGFGPDQAVDVARVALLGYGLPMHWFLARRGLNIARWRAAVLVAAVELGTGALVIGPLLLGGARDIPGGAG
jgi:hypothetical protein